MTSEARYLGRRDLAAYLSCSENKVDDMVRKGKLPEPVYLEPRMPRWDREAVDTALSGKVNKTDWYGAIDAEFAKRRPAKAQRRVG
jgi:predicted DNA-binding transcriptional regulator AlpA